MIPEIRIHRFWQDRKQTSGNCTVLDPVGFPLMGGLSLERGWQHNLSNISCIPLGIYEVVLEWSPKFRKRLWEIKGVPGRAECKFHSANYWKQLNGCIALGRSYEKDMNFDGYKDVNVSVPTMTAFHKALSPHTKATLEITGEESVF